jgi:hypothetical protein
MITTVTKEHVDEMNSMTFTAEASTLRFPPGSFPKQLDTNLGNGESLHLIELTEHFAQYRQKFNGIKLTVFND